MLRASFVLDALIPPSYQYIAIFHIELAKKHDSEQDDGRLLTHKALLSLHLTACSDKFTPTWEVALTLLFEGEIFCKMPTLMVASEEKECCRVVDLEGPKEQHTLHEKKKRQRFTKHRSHTNHESGSVNITTYDKHWSRLKRKGEKQPTL